MVTEHRGRLMKKSIWGGRNKRGIEDKRMSHPIAQRVTRIRKTRKMFEKVTESF